jgi:hypothetical protein
MEAMHNTPETEYVFAPYNLIDKLESPGRGDLTNSAMPMLYRRPEKQPCIWQDDILDWQCTNVLDTLDGVLSYDGTMIEGRLVIK